MNIIDALHLAWNAGYKTAAAYDPHAEIPMLGDYDGAERSVEVHALFARLDSGLNVTVVEDPPRIEDLDGLFEIMREQVKYAGSVEYSDCTAYWLYQLERRINGSNTGDTQDAAAYRWLLRQELSVWEDVGWYPGVYDPAATPAQRRAKIEAAMNPDHGSNAQEKE